MVDAVAESLCYFYKIAGKSCTFHQKIKAWLTFHRGVCYTEHVKNMNQGV